MAVLPSEIGSSVLESELLMLESMYSGEYIFVAIPDDSPAESHQVQFVGKFSMTVRPATAGDIAQQNISLVLELLLRPDYPHSLPVIRFHKPRGLSELQLIGLAIELECEAEKRRGAAMLYDLVDVLRDYLTRTNFPSVECPFCLCDIEEGDEFHKSECFHYCHMFCLRRYLDFVKKEKSNGEDSVKSCIVCRRKFENDIILDPSAGLREPNSLTLTSALFSGTEDLFKGTEWRKTIFEVQKSKHGLIEPEPEDTFVITLNHIPQIDRLMTTDALI